MVSDLDRAVKDIPLATLSAITHAADDSVIGDIMNTLATALRSIDKPDRVIFAELTALGLGKGPAGQTWRQLMTVDTSFFRSEFWQETRAKTRAEDIVEILEAREVAVPDDVRTRIVTCTDVDQLATWLRRAATADSVDDLFA